MPPLCAIISLFALSIYSLRVSFTVTNKLHNETSQHAASDNERLGHLNSKEEEGLPTREYSLNPPVKIKVVKKEHQQDIFSASYDNNIPDRQNKTAFITFSYLGNITKFNRIILAAVKTWIPKDEVYYVVLNHQWFVGKMT